jgi:hypothetical protein
MSEKFRMIFAISCVLASMIITLTLVIVPIWAQKKTWS